MNHPQGWPKFISNAFVVTQDWNSLIHVYLGPFSVKTVLAQGKRYLTTTVASLQPTNLDNTVSVWVDTLYPFSDTLTTTVEAEKDFDYFVRIPSWSIDQATISMNGKSKPAVPDADTHLLKLNIPKGRTTFTLNVPADITLG